MMAVTIIPRAVDSPTFGGLTYTGSTMTVSLPASTVVSAGASASGTTYQPTQTLIGLDRFRTDTRFTGIDGRGFTSVILDTGINSSHPFFGPDADRNGVADRIVYQYDFTTNAPMATDRQGHGSNVASAVGSSDSLYGGIAPGSNIIALKVLADNGSGSFGVIERALQWVVANTAKYNIVSVNMSLGDSGNYTTRTARYGIGDELAALASAGVIVVSAAGNNYFSNQTQGLAYPAADPNTIAVGAVFGANYGPMSFGSGARANTTAPDRIAPFSQRAANIDIFAPGALVTGASATGSGTTSMAGTSQAAPQVAGAAVLAQQLSLQTLGRRLSLSEFRQLITNSGVTINDGDDENDNVTNTGLNFKRLDLVALGTAILKLAGTSGPSNPATPPTAPPPNAPANSAPTLTSITTLKGPSRWAPMTISFTSLKRASDAVDADGDAIRFRIESVNSGWLLMNGKAVTAGATLASGKNFVWVPPTSGGGVFNAFTVTAIDKHGAASSAVNVSVNTPWTQVASSAKAKFKTYTRLSQTGATDEAIAGPVLEAQRSATFAQTASSATAPANTLQDAPDYSALSSVVLGAGATYFLAA